MKTRNNVLHLTVGEPIEASFSRAAAAMKAARRGKPGKPFSGVGFSGIAEMFSVFTPKRWELLGELRQSGAIGISELARRLKRDYKNVHLDCERLIEWMAIEKDENGLVFAPYSEIVVDLKMPDKRAA